MYTLRMSKKSLRVLFGAAICFVFMLCGYVYASDIRVEATVDRNKISLGSATQLNLTFYGVQNVPRPDLPDIEGFDWRYLGPSTRMSIINGMVSSSVTHMYMLVPLKAGKFTIPSLSGYHYFHS